MNYNISASSFRGYGFLNNVSKNRAKSMEKLASGYRINHSSDDSASASMSANMRAQIRGLNQATRNSDDGIELLKSADSGLEQISNIIQRIRELTVQAANDVSTPDDKLTMQEEVEQLLVEINRIAKSTEFNTIKLLNNEPDTGNLGRGLAELVGTDNITPDGKLSGRFTQYQMLDPITGGANSTINNATDQQEPILSRTEDVRTPTSCTEIKRYENFSDATGTAYNGDLFDASGNILGNVTAGSNATLLPSSSAILPENIGSLPLTPTYLYPPNSIPTNHNKWQQPTTTTPTQYVENDKNPRNYSTVSISSTAVYGKDASGALIPLSYRSYSVTREEGDEYTRTINVDEAKKSAYIDFKKFNTPGGFSVKDLYNTGFNSSCATCNNHYSVKFMSGDNFPPNTSYTPINGVSTVFQNSDCRLTTFGSVGGVHQTFEINIDNLPPNATAEDLTNYIVKTINNNKTSQPFFTHYNQYAAVGSTLYVFDHRSSQTNNNNGRDTFSAISFDQTLVDGKRELAPVKIQAGADAYEVVNVELPFISVKELGLTNISLTDSVMATESIATIDKALDFIRMERSKLGTYLNRLEYVSSVDQTTHLATTESESKVNDTNYASEMITFTKGRVLEEYGVNSIVEINKMIENVLEFIK